MGNHPTFGFRTFKGVNARLVRQIQDDGDADDSVNVMVKEGTSGWKKDVVFIRLFSYQPQSRSLYTVQARRKNGHVLLGEGSAETEKPAWGAMYTQLKERGIMPRDAET